MLAGGGCRQTEGGAVSLQGEAGRDDANRKQANAKLATSSGWDGRMGGWEGGR